MTSSADSVDIADKPIQNRESEWRAGWRVVGAAMFAYGSGMGLLVITASAFILPMQRDFGWSKQEVSMVPVVQLLAALSVPFVGKFVDRVGSRLVVLIGLLGLAVGFVLLALMPPSKLYFFVVCALMGIVSPFSNIAPLSRGIATWFRKSRGSAFGLMLNGVSLLALISVPLTSYIIQSHGWRAGYFMLAGFVLCLGLPPVVAFFRENPHVPLDVQQNKSGATLGEAIKDFRFWTFLFALSIAGFALAGFVSFLQPIFSEKGFTIAEASGLVMLFAVSISVGRIVGGILLDRFWDCGVAATLLGLSALGAVIFSVADASSPFWVTFIAVSLVGMAQGAEADFIAFFFLRLFGLRHYSTILGVMVMCVGLAGALGALTFALLGEMPESSRSICQIGAACYLVAGIVILLTGIKESAAKKRDGNIQPDQAIS